MEIPLSGTLHVFTPPSGKAVPITTESNSEQKETCPLQEQVDIPGASEGILVWCGQPSKVQVYSWGRGGWAENFGNSEPRSVYFIDPRGT